MRYLSLVLAVVLSLTLFSCHNSDEELIANGVQQIQPEQYGQFHNEAILELLKHPQYNPRSEAKDKMMLMYNIMAEKHPEYFSKDMDIEMYAEQVYGNVKTRTLNYYDLIRTVQKSNDIDRDLKELIAEESNLSFEAYDYNRIDRDQLVAFNSIREHSELLWTQQVSAKLLITPNAAKADCDPTQQVIIADAAASLILVWNPPASIVAGAAASLLVREDQIQNYNGGCATN